jgi:hypothetical protein
MPSQFKFAKFLFLVVFVLSPLYAQTYKEISYPGAASTNALGINASNQIVGAYYLINNGSPQAFLYDYNTDTYSTITPPGSSSAIAGGINDDGVIVGSYNIDYSPVGFILQNGQYTDVVYPGSAGAYNSGTQAWAINNKGIVVGSYCLPNSQGYCGQLYGFILDKGKYTSLTFPGLGYTIATGINNAGEVVGNYIGSNGGSYGFKYLNGKYTSYSYPGKNQASILSGVNNKGVLAGGYLQDYTNYGFELSKGKYTIIEYPEIDGVQNETIPNGINNNDYVVGYFEPSNSPSTTGFLYIP